MDGWMEDRLTLYHQESRHGTCAGSDRCVHYAAQTCTQSQRGTVFSHERYAQRHWRFLFLIRNTLKLFLQTTIASGSRGAACGPSRAAKEPCVQCAAHPSWASGTSHGNWLTLETKHLHITEEALAVFYIQF